MIRFSIVRVDETNYSLFAEMIARRMKEECGQISETDTPSLSAKDLSNENLFVYAAKAEDRFIGWISLAYIPKIGKWKSGHIYVDELWVESVYRRNGIAKALLAMADEQKVLLGASGVRLYVNVNNESADRLYRSLGFQENGQAYFMEK